jgi:hypothetical protein
MADLPSFMLGFDSDDDFGFTTVDHVDEVEVAVEEQKAVAKETQKDKMEEVEQMILPFLVKLYKSKEDYIHWPNPGRKTSIKKQIKSIMSVTRGPNEHTKWQDW